MKLRSHTEWVTKAQCRRVDPAMMDAPDARGLFAGKHPGPARLWRAYLVNGTICEGCPVVRECAADAVEVDEAHVIRGGIPIPARMHSRARAVVMEGMKRVATGVNSRAASAEILDAVEVRMPCGVVER